MNNSKPNIYIQLNYFIHLYLFHKNFSPKNIHNFLSILFKRNIFNLNKIPYFLIILIFEHYLSN